MSKRRHEGEETPTKVHRGPDASSGSISRASMLKGHIIGLNAQFASWINIQNNKRVDELWIDGVNDYIRHAKGLLEEFRDVVPFMPGSKEGPQTTQNHGSTVPETSRTSLMNGSGGAQAALSRGSKESSEPPSIPFSFGTNAAQTSDKDQDKQPAKKVAFNLSSSEEARGLPSSGPSEASLPFKFGTVPSAAAPSATPSESFKFGSTAAAPSSAAAPSDTSLPFKFGGAPSSAASSAAPSDSSFLGSGSGAGIFSFGAAAAPADTTAPKGAGIFSFGAAAGSSGSSGGLTSSGPAAPAPFSFGASTASGSSALGGISSSAAPFSFSVPPSSFGAPAAPATATEGDEAEEEPQKFESEVVVNEDAGSLIFKAKARFSHLATDPNNEKKFWDGKGVGTLMLRTRKEEPARPFVSFTTEAGRVLYIANIAKMMNVTVNSERNSAMFSAPWSSDGKAPPTLQGVLFQMTKGKQDEFKKAVENLQAAMPDQAPPS